ncbi:hypothetical protein [Pectobacterium phage PPWS1]|uniref:Uncharacterized protein n=1 Tax=Pectobacterium phage PPWS1 TaxID=1685500 RepID=A0A0P0UVR2_9CAUD|nr:hypothetical protein HOR09_gp08 [Pectobacterium phage PPWS1]BAS69523.1 hypothetical protein [Pectobacterium phage PPWS1]
MSKFKVGDVVERVVDSSTFLYYHGSLVGTVTAVSALGWLQIDNWRDSSGNRYPWDPAFFELAQRGADDPLPPAPTSVMYFNSDATAGNDQRLMVSQSFDGCVGITVIPRTNSLVSKAVSVYHGIGIELHPDDALQLAHDIRRMVMEIRRKERNG